MYQDIFTQAGLSSNESIVYEYLLKKGETPAGDIIKKTPLKRGVIYNALNDLIKKDLITEKKITRKSQKVSHFSPNHPNKLREYIENKERQLQKAENELESNLPQLVSAFNLISGQPGIRIYEGKKGILKVLNDSLTSKTEILTYSDIKGMETYLGRENDKYVAQRKKMNIKKRGIVTDTPYARKYLKNYDRSVTNIRFIDEKKYPLSLEMEIYDNKISLMTFSKKQLIGVIIENPEIYQTQKSIFEALWLNSIPFNKIIKN